MSARDTILRSVRAAQKTGRIPFASAGDPSAEASLTTEECLARFLVEATALNVECYTQDTPAGVRARLADLVKGCRVLSWSADRLPYRAADVLDAPMTGTASLAEQARAGVGVTGCDAAVAETGSLVLFSARGQSRTVSLLPPFHVALVERQKLFFTLAGVLEAHRALLETSASCTVITGPSRTADIELTLTLGIHGPGRVAIIIGP